MRQLHHPFGHRIGRRLRNGRAAIETLFIHLEILDKLADLHAQIDALNASKTSFGIFFLEMCRQFVLALVQFDNP
ncbi:MAG: hypothetical protein ACP5SH_17535 [Syntrophobacteraceae bacterium]